MTVTMTMVTSPEFMAALERQDMFRKYLAPRELESIFIVIIFIIVIVIFMSMQAFTVRSRLEAAVQRQPSGRSHSGASRAGSGPLHRSAHVSQEPSIIDELADVPTALHNYFQSLVQSQGDKLDHDRWVACCVQGSLSATPARFC